MKTIRDNIINALAEIKKHREIDKVDVFTEGGDNVIKCYFSNGNAISNYYNTEFVYKYSMRTPRVTKREEGIFYDVLRVLASEFRGTNVFKYDFESIAKTLRKRIDDNQYKHRNIKKSRVDVYPNGGFIITAEYKNGENCYITFTNKLRISSKTDFEFKSYIDDFYKFLKEIGIFVHRYAYQLEL